MAGSDAELKATMVPRINTGNRMSAVAAAVGAEGWVACDLCDKWRRIKEDEVAQYENKAFHCSNLPGVDCDTPEEVFTEVPEFGAGGTARPLKGRGKGVDAVRCPTCAAMLERSWAGKRWEKGSVALERHYRLSPSCRPLSEITPATLAGLIIDLSDRLPYCAVVKKDLTMWQKFNTRATSCMSFKGAAAEALWLFKQLKDSVVNEEWVKTMPNGTQDFVAKCQKCSQKEEARDIIQELEFECIDWTQVHKLWAQERPGESLARGRTTGDRTQKRRVGAGGGSKKMKTHDDGKAGWAPCDDVGETPQEEIVNDKDGISVEAAAKTAEGSGAHPQCEAALGSLVQVRLDDDSTALAVVSDVPEHFRGGVPGGVPQSEDYDNRYEVTFMDDQGRLALRDRLQLALPNEFVEVVYPSDTIYMQVLPRGWIPVPLEEGTCFVGPQGQLCSTIQEALDRDRDGGTDRQDSGGDTDPGSRP